MMVGGDLFSHLVQTEVLRRNSVNGLGPTLVQIGGGATALMVPDCLDGSDPLCSTWCVQYRRLRLEHYPHCTRGAFPVHAHTSLCTHQTFGLIHIHEV